MKTSVQPGNTITLSAPYAVASGEGLLVGSLFGVAIANAALGEPVEAVLVGVIDLKKTASQAWGVGDKLYWDNTAREVTKTAAGNTLIGAAAAAVGNGSGETLGRIRLNGTAA
jgi:predicted RecA/RadA family phage recombinase